jgi:hypothetical protein
VDRIEPSAADPALEAYLAQFDDCAIAPTRKLVAAYVRGQLSGLPRKSVMPMARQAGIPPRTLQELLSLHRWDEERMRQILRDRIQRTHGGPEAVAVLHETECPKKGTKTPGVDRQPLKSLGRVANACVISNLALFSREHALLADSELYLTQRWCQDRTMRHAAGIPEELRYRSREELALELVDRNWSAGLKAGLLLLEPGRALEPGWRRLLLERGIPFAGEVAPRARGAGGRLVEEAVALEGGPGRAVAFRPEGAEPGEAPLALVGVKPPWSQQLRYVLSGGGDWDPVQAADRALLRGSLLTRLDRDLAAVGYDHFEVRRHLSLKRHLVLSAVSLSFQQEASRGTARPSRTASLV